MRLNAIRMSLFLLVMTMLVSAPAMARQLPDFTGLVESSAPAVVNISTTQKQRTGNGDGRFALPPGVEIPDLPDGSPLGEFLRRFFGDQGIPEGAPDFDAKSLGSGFIISADGYIMTNNHVVKDADEIIVRLSDRREFEASLIGTDKRSDVALLKIEADNLPVVKIGSADRLKVGEWVLAIGSPFGFDHSVTAGIVSAKGRSLPSENYVPFIQTDVAINPGNSGGPLFNLDGEVVGVNSQIYSRTGGFMGLSFAIPIEVAMDVAGQLRDKGSVSRGWLGVLIQDVTRELAESFDMEKPVGALVAKVLPDSPASNGGLQVGDIILKFNGKEVVDSSALPPLVGQTPLNSNAAVEVLRNGKLTKLSVLIGELPTEEEVAQTSQPARVLTDKLGLRVTQPDEGEGVLVEEVKPGAAREAGIRTGDIITMLDNQQVGSVSQFREIVESLEQGKTVAVLVQRRSGPLFLAIKIE